VVAQLSHIPWINGSNPATGTSRGKIVKKLHKIYLLSMPDSTEVAQLSHILYIEGSERTNGNINATVVKIIVQTLSLIHAW
jgi:hypothetical protein